uniref:hypothetical protein n=1 Tax=Priestia megaterium TaxID=1404 RepID=UPI001F19F07D
GGGGNKEVYMKEVNGLGKGVRVDVEEIGNKRFERIGSGKVCSCGGEARQVKFLNGDDSMSVKGDELVNDGKK